MGRPNSSVSPVVSPYKEKERPAVHVLGQARVSDDKTAAVEYGVAHEPVDELVDLSSELGRFGGKLFERLGEAVADLDVAAGERALQLALVVTRDAQRGAIGDEVH